MKLPLFGLLDDALLPGEERVLATPALTASVGKHAVFVTITAPHELPALVSGRHATRAELVRDEEDGVLVRGLERVKLVKATRTEPPYEAEFEAAALATSDARAVARGLKPLAEALGEGVAEGGEAKLTAAAGALLRAALPANELSRLSRKPLPETLADAAALVRARGPAFEAEEKLEEVARALGTPEGPSPAQRRRLWSRVVEVQKKLDVYDPSVSDVDDIGRLERRLRQAGLPQAAKDIVKRELRLVRQMDGKNNELTTYLSHLDLFARLPWHAEELPPPDLAKVKEILDRDHSGMEKVKTRVLEYLAVRVLGGSSRSTVLCLVGPPGTGKTTIARAMAEALGRPFARVALGGVHDECELRGFRPTFVAAGPGRIINAVAAAGSQHALVLLDEIDKLGSDKARSPTGALLELLDPEQHTHFTDNFLQTGFDLSNILFVCTANDASDINPVLLDRLERVEIDGYGLEEKIELARTHLLPRLVKESALEAVPEVSDEVLSAVIEGHTREAGLRQLSQKLAGVLRARALAKVMDGADATGPFTLEEVEKALGRGRAPKRAREDVLPPGTAYGLSVSTDGGALLPIEILRLPGKGELKLTGRLGDVLKESAQAVLSHLRHARVAYGIEEQAFEADLHVHLPDAATPKDGPSAGVALGVAMTSALTGRPVRPDVAFTGELTLGGRVLPVGGVRAKALAAERAGLTRVVLPVDNGPDLPDSLRITPVLVKTLTEAIDVAFAAGEVRHGTDEVQKEGPRAAADGGAG